MEVSDGERDDSTLPKISDDSNNPYEYTKQNFTTEIFKIEVSNLPRSISRPALVKFLRQKKLKHQKVKVLLSTNKFKKCSHAYITFKSDPDRVEAIQTLSGCKFRGKELSCKKSDPNPDPLIRKRLEKPDVNMDSEYDELPEVDREKMINDQVCSLWQMPYNEQIIVKLERIKSVWKQCFKELKCMNSNSQLKSSLDWFHENDFENNIIHSPQINGYRNKYEFNVGADRQVGFRLGLYRQGSIRVVNPPENCPIISQQARIIWKHFQRYLLDKTDLDGYNPVTHQGFWKQILVRLNRDGESLLSITLCGQPQINETALEEEYEKIRPHFSDPTLKVKSLYIDLIEGNNQGHRSSHQPKLLLGQSHIFEQIRMPNAEKPLLFRISPTSFFQINVEGAELLFGKIFQLAKCNPQTIVLDICCGTGTIGLCLANAVKKVIGFELNQEAIEDAKFNAANNNLNNVEFYCGRAEKLVGQILDKICSDSEDIVAILDPPRNGLAASIIKSLRNNSKIKRVIYVACEAMAAKQNFIDLCRPKSNAYHKDPFVPVEAIPIDMFPHTERCEVIILFERKSQVTTL